MDMINLAAAEQVAAGDPDEQVRVSKRWLQTALREIRDRREPRPAELDA